MSEIPHINKLLIRMAKELTNDDVDSIKFMYNGIIGENKLDGAKDARGLLKVLKEKEVFNTEEAIRKFCDDTLVDIGRDDISEILFGENSKENSKSKRLETKVRKPRKRLPNQLLEIVARNLIDEWRRFARKLDIDENTITQIGLDKRTVYEQSYEVLLEWMKQIDEEDVSWTCLKEKLKAMPRYDAIREVEGEISSEVLNKYSTKATETSTLLTTPERVELPPESLSSIVPSESSAAPSEPPVVHTAQESESDDSFKGDIQFALTGGKNGDEVDEEQLAEKLKQI